MCSDGVGALGEPRGAGAVRFLGGPPSLLWGGGEVLGPLGIPGELWGLVCSKKHHGHILLRLIFNYLVIICKSKKYQNPSISLTHSAAESSMLIYSAPSQSKEQTDVEKHTF